MMLLRGLKRLKRNIAMMEFKKLLYIESDQKVNPGMVRVMLELHGIKAEVAEVKLVKEGERIVVVRKKER